MANKPYIPPLITIYGSSKTTFTCDLQKELSIGYTSHLEAITGSQNQVSHPANILWKGGEFKTIGLRGELAVGVTTGINMPGATGQTLLDMLSILYRLSLPQVFVQQGITPQLCTLIVGSGGKAWLQQTGYVSDIQSVLKAPFDEEGRPMYADITIQFTIDFGRDLKQLPNAENPRIWVDKYNG